MLHPWQSHLGSQRDWVWRGWQTRYTYIRAAHPAHADQSTPIVFLHGFGAALTQWRANLIPLSQTHTVYALDLLGFGASEKAPTDFRVELWVEQVRDFCRELIGQPVILIGHSLGALVALTTAVSDPALVQGMVLLTLPASRQELLPNWSQSWIGDIESIFATPVLIRPLLRIIRRPGFLRAVLKTVYSNREYVTDELISSFAIPAHDRGAAKVLCRLVQARTRNDFSLSTKVLLQDLDLPILLLWGEQDRVIPLTWGRQLLLMNSQLKMVEIPDSGHCPYDECADRVNQEIFTWVSTGITSDK